MSVSSLMQQASAINWGPSESITRFGDRIREAGGQFVDALKASFVGSYEGDVDEMAADVAAYAKAIDRDLEQAKAEIAKWQAIVTAQEGAVTALKAVAKGVMEAASVTKAGNQKGTLMIVTNGGVQAVKFEGDPTTLPKKLQKVTVSLDQAAARALFATDKMPTGLGIELLPRGTHLKVK